MHDELNKDTYTEQAALMFNVSEKDVTPEMRAAAKRVMFSILYTTNR